MVGDGGCDNGGCDDGGCDDSCSYGCDCGCIGE